MSALVGGFSALTPQIPASKPKKGVRKVVTTKKILKANITEIAKPTNPTRNPTIEMTRMSAPPARRLMK